MKKREGAAASSSQKELPDRDWDCKWAGLGPRGPCALLNPVQKCKISENSGFGLTVGQGRNASCLGVFVLARNTSLFGVSMLGGNVTGSGVSKRVKSQNTFTSSSVCDYKC